MTDRIYRHTIKPYPSKVLQHIGHMLCGLVLIIEGLISICSLGFFGSDIGLVAITKMIQWRYKQERKHKDALRQ